jgi:hypothetical protein
MHVTLPTADKLLDRSTFKSSIVEPGLIGDLPAPVCRPLFKGDLISRIFSALR